MIPQAILIILAVAMPLAWLIFQVERLIDRIDRFIPEDEQ